MNVCFLKPVPIEPKIGQTLTNLWQNHGNNYLNFAQRKFAHVCPCCTTVGGGPYRNHFHQKRETLVLITKCELWWLLFWSGALEHQEIVLQQQCKFTEWSEQQPKTRENLMDSLESDLLFEGRDLSVIFWRPWDQLGINFDWQNCPTIYIFLRGVFNLIYYFLPTFLQNIQHIYSPLLGRANHRAEGLEPLGHPLLELPEDRAHLAGTRRLTKQMAPLLGLVFPRIWSVSLNQTYSLKLLMSSTLL